MKPVIAIPSYNRPDSKALQKLKNIPLEVYVYVRKEQVPLYRKYKDWGYKIIALKNVTEIGLTRRAIVKHLDSIGVRWAFMFDDDIGKVELLKYSPERKRYDSERILQGSPEPPRIELRALKLWYNLAKAHKLSLSTPCYRPDLFAKGTHIQINSATCIQCVLLHIPDIVEVGNYHNIHETGNEDYYIQYKLMEAGYRTARIGLIEYDCPSIGNVEDGTDDGLIPKYTKYIKNFQENVCGDPELVTTKISRSGVPSLKFVWKNWYPETISLKEDYYEQI